MTLEERVELRAKMMLRVLIHLFPTYPNPQTVDVRVALPPSEKIKSALLADPAWEMARDACEQLLRGKVVEGHGIDLSTFQAALSPRTEATLRRSGNSGQGSLFDEISGALTAEANGQSFPGRTFAEFAAESGCAPSLASFLPKE